MSSASSTTAPTNSLGGTTRMRTGQEACPGVTRATRVAIAQDLAFDTDEEVTSYNQHLKATHQLRQLKPPIRHFSAPNAIRSVPGADLLSAIPARSPRPSRSLTAAQPRLDSVRRVGLTRVAGSLGWTSGDLLTACIDNGRVLLTRESGTVSGIRLDAQRRVTLSPAMCFNLGVEPGDQLQAIGDADAGTLTLLSLARALQVLTERAA